MENHLRAITAREGIHIIREEATGLQIFHGGYKETIEDDTVISVIEGDPRQWPDADTPCYDILHVRDAFPSGKKSFRFGRTTVTEKLPASFLKRHLGPARPSHLYPRPTDGRPNFHVAISTPSGLEQAEEFYNNVVEFALWRTELERAVTIFLRRRLNCLPIF